MTGVQEHLSYDWEMGPFWDSIMGAIANDHCQSLNITWRPTQFGYLCTESSGGGVWGK